MSKTEKKFKKDKLINNFPKYSYVLKTLLKDDKEYTLNECETILNKFLKKEVK